MIVFPLRVIDVPVLGAAPMRHRFGRALDSDAIFERRRHRRQAAGPSRNKQLPPLYNVTFLRGR